MRSPIIAGLSVCVILAAGAAAATIAGYPRSSIDYGPDLAAADIADMPPPKPLLDKALYDRLMLGLANNPKPAADSDSNRPASSTPVSGAISPPISFVSTSVLVSSSTDPHYLWPAENAPYPEYGAILPWNRVVAYYGNFLSPRMGVLGQYPPQEMLTKLMEAVAEWRAADPSTPVIPAIDYIAVAAQGYPGADGMYRARMPASEIQKAVDLAGEVDGLVILDIQIGLSTVRQEVPLLEPFLKLPNVELALDPEFAMRDGQVPGREIGRLDASDIDYAADYLAGLVKKYNLPPKFLVIHRFTEEMVADYENITPLPQVEIVMDMDGYGTVAQKVKVYKQIIYPEPVQFAGLKLFYKNDAESSGGMMTPAEVLSLRPKPIFIQYQ